MPNFGRDRREADMTRASWACRSDEFDPLAEVGDPAAFFSPEMTGAGSKKPGREAELCACQLISQQKTHAA
jgi:hypothetical protein